MASKDTGKTPVEPEVAIHRIRITLTSRNVKSLEKVQAPFLLLLPAYLPIRPGLQPATLLSPALLPAEESPCSCWLLPRAMCGCCTGKEALAPGTDPS
ncbi:unnamed protein product [Rangifer tarandus platyrhynchus]|uniref:Uncharacterized protein n=1 Tax=Rangifer tarandus platyrhynchus TaxID=3082113 RepID=A0AC59Y248_RANTA